jgi:hypothetical protein
MKLFSILPILFCTLAVAPLWGNTTAFQITGTVKTESRDKSDRQQLPRATTRLITEEKVLHLSIRRTNPTLGEHAEVKWVVLVEGMRGTTSVAAAGSQRIHTAVGVPVEITSDAFTLKERTFNGEGKRGDGSLEQSVKGYGVIIVDAQGRELGSKFQPSSIEEDVRALQAAQEKRGDEGEAEGGRPKRNVPRRLR